MILGLHAKSSFFDKRKQHEGRTNTSDYKKRQNQIRKILYEESRKFGVKRFDCTNRRRWKFSATCLISWYWRWRLRWEFLIHLILKELWANLCIVMLSWYSTGNNKSSLGKSSASLWWFSVEISCCVCEVWHTATRSSCKDKCTTLSAKAKSPQTSIIANILTKNLISISTKILHKARKGNAIFLNVFT